MPRITDVYRPVAELDWLQDLENYAKEQAPQGSICINEPEDCLVRLIKRSELDSMSVPATRGIEYVLRSLKATMPETFSESMTVAGKGVAYKKRHNTLLPSGLFVKLTSDPRLEAENDALFTTLGQYNVRPGNGLMYFYAHVGSIILGKFESKERISTRYGLSELVPSALVLGESHINTSGQD